MKFSLDNYLEQCIINDISPVDTQFYRDFQFRWVIKSLQNAEGKTIVDYGCGKCRLFGALNNKVSDFDYLAVDTEELCAIFKEDSRYRYIDTKEVFGLVPQSVDYFVVCNVIHELSIIEIAEMLEKARFLLKDNGTLIICDVMILPKGELTACQWFPEDFECLFQDFLDESFCTITGFPIVAVKVNKSQIKTFTTNIEKIEEIYAKHSNEGAMLMSLFDKTDGSDFIKVCNELKLPDKTQKRDALGYILHRTNVAHFRVIQSRQRKKLISENIYQTILTYIVGIYDLYRKSYGKCTIFDLYCELCPHFRLLEIAFCIEASMDFGIGTGYFFPEKKGDIGLEATEHIDDFLEGNPEFDDILCDIKLIPTDKNNVVRVIDRAIAERSY